MNAAPSFFPQYRALAMSEPAPILQDTLAERRDHALASAQQAWQENAELRAGLSRVVEMFVFAASMYAPGSIARNNSERVIAEARALLAKVRQ